MSSVSILLGTVASSVFPQLPFTATLTSIKAGAVVRDPNNYQAPYQVTSIKAGAVVRNSTNYAAPYQVTSVKVGAIIRSI